MPEITYREALNQALAEEIERDDNVVLLGEEVAQFNIPELMHRNFRDDEFWKKIPGWAGVTREEFADHK